MRVFAFRAGRKAGVWVNDVSVPDLVEFCKRHKDNWLEQSEWFFEDLPIGAESFVATQLIVLQNRRRITHVHSAREKLEPDTVFIGALGNEEFEAARQTAIKEWMTSQRELRSKLRESRSATKKAIKWGDLTESEQGRLQGSNLSIKSCWIWRPAKSARRDDSKDSRNREAPYRDFYIRNKGPVPKGAVLRHSCDNRMCMNPNHLLLGTTKDNVRDMMKRSRHAAQVIETRRRKWREAAARRRKSPTP